MKTIPQSLADICSGKREMTPEHRDAYKAWCLRNVGVFEQIPTKHSERTVQLRTTPNRLVQLSIAFECSNRSQEPIRSDVSNLCGTKGDAVNIFKCSVHGECSLGRYCTKQTVKSCIGCQDIRRPEKKVLPFPQEPGPSPFRRNGPPEFISTEQLMRDVEILITKIPANTSRIIGVSRSGVCPASMVAMRLHLPLSIVRQSMNDLIDAGSGWRLSGNVGGSGEGPVIVIDDTVMSGNSFKHVMPIVRAKYPNALSAAIYVNPYTRLAPDIFVRHLPWPHCLEWNLFNTVITPSCAFDFDGILCADCAPQDDDDGERYRGFLLTATPKYVVRKVAIPLIVTARLEKWRPETEEWLAANGMVADKIIMGPWKNNHERGKADIGQWKGIQFKAFMNQSRRRIQPAMFIESEEWQARRIAQVSGGIVVCPAARKCFHA